MRRPCARASVVPTFWLKFSREPAERFRPGRRDPAAADRLRCRAKPARSVNTSDKCAARYFVDSSAGTNGAALQAVSIGLSLTCRCKQLPR
jgi:hypothetical protein